MSLRVSTAIKLTKWRGLFFKSALIHTHALSRILLYLIMHTLPQRFFSTWSYTRYLNNPSLLQSSHMIIRAWGLPTQKASWNPAGFEPITRNKQTSTLAHSLWYESKIILISELLAAINLKGVYGDEILPPRSTTSFKTVWKNALKGKGRQKHRRDHIGEEKVFCKSVFKRNYSARVPLQEMSGKSVWQEKRR